MTLRLVVSFKIFSIELLMTLAKEEKNIKTISFNEIKHIVVYVDISKL